MNGSPDGFRPIQYLLVAAAVLAVGLVSQFFDRSPPELTLLKVIMIPVIALAASGVERQFVSAEAYLLWSRPMIERVALTALVAASGVTLLLSRAETSLSGLLWFFALVYVAVALIAAFGPLVTRRKRQG